MKKNAMLKIAAVLLVAVLLTTCAISSTFAKYTTGSKDIVNTKAEVAGWGLDLKVTTEGELFKSSYANGKVASTDGKLLMAPGTSGTSTYTTEVKKLEGYTADLEVAAKVTYNCTVAVTGFGDGYCPVTFDVNGTPVTANSGSNLQSALQSAIETELNGNTDIAAGATDFSAYGRDLEISWNWEFESNNDDKDTLLGNNPNGNTISIVITASVDQVKPA